MGGSGGSGVGGADGAEALLASSGADAAAGDMRFWLPAVASPSTMAFLHGVAMVGAVRGVRGVRGGAAIAGVAIVGVAVVNIAMEGSGGG
eukprot:160920-Chlamydomonas_euryale.AAC.1